MEPQPIDANLVWLNQTVESLGPALASIMVRLDALENEVRNSVKRRDSVSIGTDGKGGNLKVYIDALGDPAENDKAVEEAKRVLMRAGGLPGGM